MNPLKILSDGPHHVAVFKPHNCVVIAGRGAPRPTLLEQVRAQGFSGAQPVHRIDRVTSGICLFAKTDFGKHALSNAFRKHLIDKRYLCIVEGVPSFKKLSVNERLKRIDTPEDDAKAFAHQEIDDDGKRALTHLKVLASENGFSLIEAKPQTGRMHQIRIHLAHVGHPIVGDALYGSQVKFADKAVALYAYFLSFPSPKGPYVTVSAQIIPPVFIEFIQKHGLYNLQIAMNQALKPKIPE